MERGLHRFVRLLRGQGVRVSVTETLDAMRAAAQPGALADRDTLRCVLRVALVKDRRDETVFDELFDRYFRLEPVVATGPGHDHSHAHDDLVDSNDRTRHHGHDHRTDDHVDHNDIHDASVHRELGRGGVRSTPLAR